MAIKRAPLVWILACVVAVALLVWLRSRRVDEAHESHAASAERRPAMTTVLPPILPSPATVAAGAEMSISGVLISRLDGSAVSGAELTFSSKGQVYSVTTLTEGTFTFEPPEPGTYQLAAIDAAGFLPSAPAWGDSPLELVARPGFQLSGIVLRVEPTAELALRVTDPSGAPIASARVGLALPSTMNTTVAALAAVQLTDASGALQISVPVGALVKVAHPEFVGRVEQVSLDVWKRKQLTLALTPRPPSALAPLDLPGRVVDGNGVGMVDVMVTARPQQVSPFSDELRWWNARTGSDGGFVIRWLPTGMYTLTATSPGRIPARLDNVPASATGVVLQLTDKGGAIAGEVVADTSSKPVASFTVILSQALGKLEERPLDTRTFLDAQGKFVVAPLAAGSYRLRVTAHGHAISRAYSIEVDDAATARVEIRLPAGGTVEGVVRDAATRSGIAGAQLVLDGSSRITALPLELETSAVAGSDGAFRMTGVPEGLRSITATARGYNGRVMSGIAVRDERASPVDIELTAVAPGEAAVIELTGIGAGLAAQGDVLVIGRVIEGGGAAEAGLAPGDHILAIGTTQVATLDLNGATQLIRGPVGTTVTLRIRSAQQPERSVVVTRRAIEMPAAP